jgi:hypothetical protein
MAEMSDFLREIRALQPVRLNDFDFDLLARLGGEPAPVPGVFTDNRDAAGGDARLTLRSWLREEAQPLMPPSVR